MHEKSFIYNYNDKKIPYSIWFTGDSNVIQTIIFLGTVQVGKLPQWVTELCPPKTAIVQGAPHWHAKDDGSDIPEYMANYTEAAFNSINSSHILNRLHIITDSQATPGVIDLFSKSNFTQNIQNMAFIQPLGFTSNVFEGSSKQRISKFKKRIIKNGYHQLSALLLDSKLRYNHRILYETINFKDKKAIAQYNSGLSHDSLPELKKLYELMPNIIIICGSKDKVFPAKEIKSNLNKIDVPIQVLNVKGIPHSPLATKMGSRLLLQAFDFLDC